MFSVSASDASLPSAPGLLLPNAAIGKHRYPGVCTAAGNRRLPTVVPCSCHFACRRKETAYFYHIGSRENWKHTIAASPSIPRRRSVNPSARYTFLNCETRASFSMAESLHDAAEHLHFRGESTCLPNTGHWYCRVIPRTQRRRSGTGDFPAETKSSIKAPIFYWVCIYSSLLPTSFFNFMCISHLF